MAKEKTAKKSVKAKKPVSKGTRKEFAAAKAAGKYVPKKREALKPISRKELLAKTVADKPKPQPKLKLSDDAKALVKVLGGKCVCTKISEEGSRKIDAARVLHTVEKYGADLKTTGKGKLSKFTVGNAEYEIKG